jgi:hypothetical protein
MINLSGRQHFYQNKSSLMHCNIVDAIYFKAPIFLDKKIDSFLQHAIVLGQSKVRCFLIEYYCFYFLARVRK